MGPAPPPPPRRLRSRPTTGWVEPGVVGPAVERRGRRPAHLPGQPDPHLLRQGARARGPRGALALSRRERRDVRRVDRRTARSRPGAAPAGPASPRCGSRTAAPGWPSAPTTRPCTSSTPRPASDILRRLPDRRHHQGLGHHRPRRLPARSTRARATTTYRVHRPRPRRADRGAVDAVGRRGRARRKWNNDWDGSALSSTTTCSRAARTASSTSSSSTAATGADGKVTVAPELVFNAPGWDDELLAAIGDQDVSIENSVAISGNTVYFANSGGLVQGWDITGLAEGQTPHADVPVLDRRRHRRHDRRSTSEGMLYVASEYERGNEQARTNRPAHEARPDASRTTRSSGRSTTTTRCRRASGPRRPSHDGMVYVVDRRRSLPRRRPGDRRGPVGEEAPGPDVAVAGGRRRRADRGRLQRRPARLRRVRTRARTRRSCGRSSSAAASSRRRRCGTGASTWAPGPAGSAPSATDRPTHDGRARADGSG